MPRKMYVLEEDRANRGFITFAELMDAKFCHVIAKKPECENTPRGEWYCWNDDCVVHEVVVKCVLYGEKMPTMHCPACSSKMEFHHWVEEETLFLVDETKGESV